MKLRWTAVTASGARRFASSGVRRPGTAAERTTPRPPSATSGSPVFKRDSKLATRPGESSSAVNYETGDGSTSPGGGDSNSHLHGPVAAGPEKRGADTPTEDGVGGGAV